MLERLFEIKKPLSAVIAFLPNAPDSFTILEWRIIEDCVKVLKQAYNMTNELCGSKYVTLSLVIPLIRGV